jgi:hypothetical protein
MKRWAIVVVWSVVPALFGSALGAQRADERAPTSVTIILSTAIEMLQVGGDLDPDHFGDSLRVSQFKIRKGGWKKIDVQEVVMEDFGSAGDFVTIFELFDKGRCKIKVRFPGDDDHLPGSARRRYRCSGEGLEGPARR